MSQTLSRESHHSPGFNPEAKEPAAAAAKLGGILDVVYKSLLHDEYYYTFSLKASQSGSARYHLKQGIQMKKLYIFQTVFRALFFLACLSFAMRQCYLSMEAFLQNPTSTSVVIDFAKKWPMPRITLCPTSNDEYLEDTCDLDPYVLQF